MSESDEIRRSPPPISKRFKHTPTTGTIGTGNRTGAVDDRDCTTTGSTTTPTQTPSLLSTDTAGTMTILPTTTTTTTTTAATSTASSSPLEVDHTLQHILSYVGAYHYRFIGSVNHMFHKTYVSLYPQTETYIKASTIELTKMMWDEIDNDEIENNEEDDYGSEDDDFRVPLEWKLKRIWDAVTRRGNTDVVKYFSDLLWIAYDTDRTGFCANYEPCAHSAIKYGREDILRWLLQNVPYNEDENWRYGICCKAAEHGRLDFLQLFVESGSDCYDMEDERVCQSAISNGHIHIYDWAVQKGFAWDNKDDALCLATAHITARNGQLEALQWMYANGCDIMGNDELGDDVGCCHNAAKYGHFEVLKWLIDVGCQYDDDITEVAVQRGHIKVLEYLLSEGCYYTTESCTIAARDGNLEALQVLRSYIIRSYDDEWEEWFGDHAVAVNAAAFGHLEIIEWTRDNGCPWSESFCQYASGHGQLRTLQWLRTKGCPWDETTTTYAANVEVYQWAVDNGCPIAVGNPRMSLGPYERVRDD